MDEVIFAKSLVLIFLIRDRNLTVCTILAGSLGLPLNGSGDRYGESVSTRILSLGSDKKVSAKSFDFLNVTIPLADI